MEANTRALRGTYTGYSIGVAIAWAVRLVLAWKFASADNRRKTLLVFFGFAIGWLSATIARSVYPPPKKYRQETAPLPD
jgi:hypothetical protein